MWFRMLSSNRKTAVSYFLRLALMLVATILLRHLPDKARAVLCSDRREAGEISPRNVMLNNFQIFNRKLCYRIT